MSEIWDVLAFHIIWIILNGVGGCTGSLTVKAQTLFLF